MQVCILRRQTSLSATVREGDLQEKEWMISNRSESRGLAKGWCMCNRFLIYSTRGKAAGPPILGMRVDGVFV